MNIKRNIKLLFPGLYLWYSARTNCKHKKMNEMERRDELCKLYKFYTGRDLEWANLQSYTEKMQWKKMYYTNNLEKTASDKYAVREWVANKIGREFLIPIFGVWDSFEDIDFSLLPHQFVLKASHSSANCIIVKDKTKLDIRLSALMFRHWLSLDYAYTSFEMNYEGIPPRIIAEQYMQNQDGELPDYKFLCFNGEPYCCWVDHGRFTHHTRDIYDINWNIMPWTDAFPNSGIIDTKPKNFDRMVELARTLSKDFLHVRVDLYNIDGTIYFGELTFCESSGFCKITPIEMDYKLGDMWKLPITKCPTSEL